MSHYPETWQTSSTDNEREGKREWKRSVRDVVVRDGYNQTERNRLVLRRVVSKEIDWLLIEILIRERIIEEENARE